MYLVIRDGDKPETFASLDEAIVFGQEREAFTVYDDDDIVVLQTRPGQKHLRY